MAENKIRWDVDILRGSVQSLKAERANLQAQRGQMQQQKERVDVSWKSPAGQQYQNRLTNDIRLIDIIITQLDKMIDSIQKASDRYNNCENQVSTAVKRLPV